MAKNCRSYLLVLACICSIRLSYGQADLRQRVVDTLLAQVGVRELTGHNDGVEVAKYLRAVGLPESFAWCSALGCWGYKVNGAPNPNNAMASSWFPDSKVIYRRENRKFIQPVRQADAGGIWFDNPRGIHHVVFILRWNGTICKDVEGNTSDANTGSSTREGQGCYLKYRSCKQIAIVSSWIK